MGIRRKTAGICLLLSLLGLGVVQTPAGQVDLGGFDVSVGTGTPKPASPSPTAAVPTARPVTPRPTAVPTARPVTPRPTAAPTTRPVTPRPTAIPTTRPVTPRPTAVPTVRPAAPKSTAVPTGKPVTPRVTAAAPTVQAFMPEPTGMPAVMPPASSSVPLPTEPLGQNPILLSPAAAGESEARVDVTENPENQKRSGQLSSAASAREEDQDSSPLSEDTSCSYERDRRFAAGAGPALRFDSTRSLCVLTYEIDGAEVPWMWKSDTLIPETPLLSPGKHTLTLVILEGAERLLELPVWEFQIG